MPTATRRRTASKGTKTAARGNVRPDVRFRLRIMADDLIAIGPGKIALIEAVSRTGSITAAAKSLDMSYRRAWLLIEELNRSLARPAVDSAKGGVQGGGSELTDVGQQLIELYRRIETHAAHACRDDIKRIVGLLAR